MDYYELKDKISTYLESDDIETSKDFISAYDLLASLKAKLKQLREIKSLEKQFIEKFEPHLTFDELSNTKSIFKKDRLRKRGMALSDYSVGATANFGSVWLCFRNYDRSQSDSMYVKRDFDSTELYANCSDEFYLNFIRNNREIITQMLDVIEEVKEFLNYIHSKKCKNYAIEEIYTDGLFKIELKMSEDGIVDYIITIPNDKNNICYRNYLDKPSINSIITENESVLLKKIAIPVEQLNPIIKDIASEKLVSEKVKKK